MISLEEKDDVSPVCPHCEKELNTVFTQEMTGYVLGKRYIYFCEHCRKVLGLSHRKGYISG